MTKNKKQIPLKEAKVLWGKSGDLCAICKILLTQELIDGSNETVGEMAHIEGENPGSARYNKNMTDSDRCKYDNLILLCPTCHTKIDNDPNFYTVDRLKELKASHEKWVRDKLTVNLLNVTFAEMEVIISYLAKEPIYGNLSSLNVIPPEQKIKRNNLSPEIGNMITLGMVQAEQVKKYLNQNPDIDFANRLKHQFVKKYNELKDCGYVGDVLFYEMWNFASLKRSDFMSKAAGLSVLVYFFEICEVFEK